MPSGLYVVAEHVGGSSANMSQSLGPKGMDKMVRTLIQRMYIHS